MQNFTGATPRQNFENLSRGRGSPGKGLSYAGSALIRVKISKLRRDLVIFSPDIAFKRSKMPGEPRSKQEFHRGCALAKVLKGVFFAGWPPARPSAVPGPEGHPRGIGRGCPALIRRPCNQITSFPMHVSPMSHACLKATATYTIQSAPRP